MLGGEFVVGVYSKTEGLKMLRSIDEQSVLAAYVVCI